MMLVGYFDIVREAIEFVMAIGSLMGIFGLLYAAAWWYHTTPKGRGQLFKLIIVSLVLIGICGAYTGIKYFRI